MDTEKTIEAVGTQQSAIQHVAHALALFSAKTGNSLTEGELTTLLERCQQALGADDANRLMGLASQAVVTVSQRMSVTEVRPQVLECDVVRFQNNKEKWVALVGLLDGAPYEIFTGLQDDEEGIMLPKSVTKGKIIKQVNADGTKRYDFQFENKRGYKTTVEGLSEKFNPEYWNYAKLISGVLRYGMPIAHVIRLVGSMQMKDESINTWKNGVERALKKYLNDGAEDADQEVVSSSAEQSDASAE